MCIYVHFCAIRFWGLMVNYLILWRRNTINPRKTMNQKKTPNTRKQRTKQSKIEQSESLSENVGKNEKIPQVRYNKAQFERAVGLNPGAIYNLIRSGRLKEKGTYSQKDVNIFLKAKNIDSEAAKHAQHVKGVPAKEISYTLAQVAVKVGFTKPYLYSLRKKGEIETKDLYSEHDFIKIKEFFETKKRLTPITKPIAHHPIDLSDDAVNPFQIHKNVNPAFRDQLLFSKLIAMMKTLEPNSPHGVPVSLAAFKTKSKINQVIKDAKAKMAETSGFENVQWDVIHHKVENVYTLSYLVRKIELSQL